MHNLSNEYFENQFENNETSYELSPEFALNEFGETNYELSPEYAYENPQAEINEIALAQELMEVSNEDEFFDWLKNTAKKAAGVASSFLDSPTGQKATQALTTIAQKTLPAAGKLGGGFLGRKGGEAIGSAIGAAIGPEGIPIGQAIGGWAGGKLGTWGGGKAGQYAASKFPAFVNFTKDTIRNLANEVSQGNSSPSVKNAITRSAKRYYPIILQVRGTLQARPVRGGSFFGGQQQSSGQMRNEYNESGEYNEIANGEILHNEGSFNEITEMQLASEMLNIQSEDELDRFLGKLFKKAAGAVSNFAKSGAGKALGGMLKTVAKTALPMAGSALGSALLPGIGTAIGGQLGSAASNLFEVQLEGLSAEDREFQTARAFVRFAGNAARRASRNRGGNSYNNARKSFYSSARKYAPGLISSSMSSNYSNSSGGGGGSDIGDTGDTGDYYDDGTDTQETGSWRRIGNRLVIEGLR